MFTFDLPCGAGLRRDCQLGEKCVARHIGESPRKMNFGSVNRMTSLRKKYGTRSTTRTCSPRKGNKKVNNIGFNPMKLKSVIENTEETSASTENEQYERTPEKDDTISDTDEIAEIKKYNKTTYKLQTRINSLEPVYGHENFYKTGLKNLGNTCFMNAIIQCLNATEVLTDSLLDANQNSKLTGISKELNFISMVMKSSEYRSVSPRDFRRELELANPIFKGFKQHDAQEVLSTILEYLEKELKQEANTNKISEIFDSDIMEIITCSNCKDTSKPIDQLRFLQVEVPKRKSTLNECIKYGMKEEQMTEKPCLKCRNSAEEACKKRVFNKPPEILIIHLKRFSHDGRWMRKIHTPIECPMILDIGKYTENGATCRYQLYSIANHIGGSSSGHYTATCRDPADTKNWYCHDDETTSDGINETDVTTKDAYILFYKKEFTAEKSFQDVNPDLIEVEEDVLMNDPLICKEFDINKDRTENVDLDPTKSTRRS